MSFCSEHIVMRIYVRSCFSCIYFIFITFLAVATVVVNVAIIVDVVVAVVVVAVVFAVVVSVFFNQRFNIFTPLVCSLDLAFMFMLYLFKCAIY